MLLKSNNLWLKAKDLHCHQKYVIISHVHLMFSPSLPFIFNSIISLITCSYHLNLIFYAMSTTPHILISSFHSLFDRLFISCYVFILWQHCFHLLCDVHHPTSTTTLLIFFIHQPQIFALFQIPFKSSCPYYNPSGV